MKITESAATIIKMPPSGLIAKFHTTDEFRKSPDFSLVLPCYKESNFLLPNVERLLSILSLLKIQFELIFVEDASPDQTRNNLLRLAERLTERNIPFKLLLNEKNIGRGGSVKRGLLAASGKIAGFIDIDLENLPEALIPMFLKVRDQGFDLVVGTRIKGHFRSCWQRKMVHLACKRISHLFLDLPISDSETGCKVFQLEKILQILPLTPNDHWFWDTELVYVSHKIGYKITEHPVVFVRNPDKPRTVRIFRDSFLHMKEIFAYSYAMGRIARKSLHKINQRG